MSSTTQPSVPWTGPIPDSFRCVIFSGIQELAPPEYIGATRSWDSRAPGEFFNIVVQSPATLQFAGSRRPRHRLDHTTGKQKGGGEVWHGGAVTPIKGPRQVRYGDPDRRARRSADHECSELALNCICPFY